MATTGNEADINMSNGHLMAEDKFVARLRGRTYRALTTGVVKADIHIEAARQNPDSHPNKVRVLVRYTRQRELLVAEMNRRIRGGFAPPSATIKARPALLTAKVIMGGKGVQKGSSNLIRSIKEPEEVG